VIRRTRSTAWSRCPASAAAGLSAAPAASQPEASGMRSTAAGAGRRRVRRYHSWSWRGAPATGPAAISGSGIASRRPCPGLDVAEQLDVAQPEERAAEDTHQRRLVGRVAERAEEGGQDRDRPGRREAGGAAHLDRDLERLQRARVAGQRRLAEGQ